jgi:hypothetical protein
LNPFRAFGFALAPLLGAALLPAAAQARTGCRISVGASADGSFAQAGYDARPARLRPLAAATRDRFTAAARRLCGAGVLRQSDLARFRKLVVQNGEGATEALIYRDETMERGTFVFQFAFQNGGPPTAVEFERALRCWKRPQAPGCDSGD